MACCGWRRPSSPMFSALLFLAAVYLGQSSKTRSGRKETGEVCGVVVVVVVP